MPRPYTPPLDQRPQAVRSARAGRRLPRRRAWWLLPLVGLLPVVAAVVLASEGRFGSPTGQPVATGAVGTSATAPQAAANATAPQPAATPASTLAAGSQPSAAQPTQSTGTSATAATGTSANTAAGAGASPNTGAGAGTSPNTGAGAGTSSNQASAAGAAANQSTSTNTTGSTSQDRAPTNEPFRAYAVQPGDTVKFVAQMYGVSPASISQASGLQNPDHLRIGQVLTIPTQPGWLYRVQPGESLTQIAARTGVATDIILSASNFPSDTVRAGDVILIPDQAVAFGK